MAMLVMRHTCFRDTLAFADVKPEAATKANRLLLVKDIVAELRKYPRSRKRLVRNPTPESQHLDTHGLSKHTA